MLKFFAGSVIFLVLLVLVFNVYLYFKQPGMVFYPLAEIEQTPQDWDLKYDAVKLKTSSHVTLTGWYLPAPATEKTLLFFHGNGGNISHRGDSLYIFHKLNINTFIIDYPGYGESEGSPSEKGLYQAADAAWQYLVRDKNIKPKNIIIFGRSLGGVAAADLASRVNAGGLILESTFSSARDIANMAFPLLSHFIYMRYSFATLDKISKIKVPVLVIHSPDDEVIPYELGVKNYKNIKTKKYFLPISGGHNDGFMQNLSTYIPALREFIFNT